MSKAILITDMPSCCKDCPLCVSEELFPDFDEYYCIIENTGVDEHDKPDWCPLKPVPEKYDVLAAIENNPNYDPSYDVGRNDCIDEIMGD